MAAIIDQYLAAPPPARLANAVDTKKWLDELLAQSVTALNAASSLVQAKLATAIVDDLTAASGSRDKDIVLNIRQNVRWDSQTRLAALRVLKELSRTPSGSAPLAQQAGLRALLLQVDFAQQAVRRNSLRSSTSPQTRLSSLARTLRRVVDRRESNRNRFSTQSLDDTEIGLEPDWPVTDMALRCLNNALFLHEDARLPFSSDEIGGGHVAVALLSHPENTPADILFLGARLLFFSTLFEAPFNKTAVETLHVVRLEAHCVGVLVKASLEKSRAPQASSNLLITTGSEAQFALALSDLLKAHFNICLYYPRIIEAEQKKMHSNGMSPDGASASSGSYASTPSTDHKPVLGEAFRPELLEMVQPLLLLLTTLPIPQPVPLVPPFTHAVAALLNYPVAEVKQRFAQVVSSNISPTSTANDFVTIPGASLTTSISPASTEALRAAPAYITRLILLADLMLARYLSHGQKDTNGSTVEDVDDKTITRHASNDGVELEDNLEPLLLLLRKNASEDGDIRHTLKAILLPTDLTREAALDKRIDVLGRLVRLMSSVTLSRLARAAGEVLLAVCGDEPKRMTEEIGYGPCAGFLLNTGRASALPAGSGVSADGRPVNPITGEYLPTEAELAGDAINGLTDEEKQAEAEKLFVLFDRMNRTGVISVQNPVQAAHESGRFHEISDAVNRDALAQQQAEEDADEQAVDREMAALKKRKEEAHRRAMRLVAHPPN